MHGGGMILFGIKDKTGEIIGLSYQESPAHCPNYLKRECLF